MSYDEHLISQAGGDGCKLDHIQVRLEGLGSTNWYVDHDGDVATGVSEFFDVGGDLRTASFVANAPTDIEALLTLVREQAAKLEAVRELHAPVTKGGKPIGCSMCDWDHPDYDIHKQWPCPTIAALEQKP